MNDENEIINPVDDIINPIDEVENPETNIVEPENEVVETPEIIETKVVETEVENPRDEFINLDNLKVFPDEINIF